MYVNRAANPDVNGTHVASTAAGNYINGISFFGYAPGTTREVTSRTHVSAYKVIGWDGGSFELDDLAGIDQAVVDGVDILEKGIFVSVSTGNRGLGAATLLEGISWAFIVALGTIDRWFAGTITLGDGKIIIGWIMLPARAVVRKLPLVYNETLSICNSRETVSFSVHENKAIPVSSFEENCSYIDAIDVLAEEVFLQEIGAPWRSETSSEELAMDEAYLKCGGDEWNADEMETLLGEGMSLMQVMASTEEEVKPTPELELKELPSHLKYADWRSFQDHFDTSMGQFQQSFQQSYADSMGQFRQHLDASMGQFQQTYSQTMGQFQQRFDASMGEFRQELGSLRQDVGDLRQSVFGRLDSHDERMTALEQSWNNWTLSYPYPPPPQPPYEPPPQ
ncbi:hypothetical protein C2S52_015552 [Perilla frutescens var. hirtella]|nr:hypothetical protein C2S52_015552 [Perilla frutescens var. hirtella]